MKRATISAAAAALALAGAAKAEAFEQTRYFMMYVLTSKGSPLFDHEPRIDSEWKFHGPFPTLAACEANFPWLVKEARSRNLDLGNIGCVKTTETVLLDSEGHEMIGPPPPISTTALPGSPEWDRASAACPRPYNFVADENEKWTCVKE